MEDSDFPGNTSAVFTLKFGTGYYSNDEVLYNGMQQLQVISEPIKKYWKWYWRIPEFLTLGNRFNSRYEYKVKVL